MLISIDLSFLISEIPKHCLQLNNMRGNHILSVIVRKSHDTLLESWSLLEYIMVRLQRSESAYRGQEIFLARGIWNTNWLMNCTQQGGTAYIYRSPILQ